MQSFRCLSFPVLLMMMTKECQGNLVQHQTQSKYFLIQPSMLSMFTKFLITSLHKNPVYLLRKYLVSSIMEVSFLYFYCPSRCLLPTSLFYWSSLIPEVERRETLLSPLLCFFIPVIKYFVHPLVLDS